MVRHIVWDGHELVWSGDGREYLRGVGARYLLHPFFEEGFNRILEYWRPSKRYVIGLFLPCAYGKPYSQSYIHYFILKALRSLGEDYDKIHQIIVTNAGIVPRELEEYYPYCAYDWNPRYETPDVKELYRAVTYRRLKKFIEKFGKYYDVLACYLRWDSDSFQALRRALTELGYNVVNLAAKPEEVPLEELREVSLNGLYEDEDLILITKTSLGKLVAGIKRILYARSNSK